MITDRRGKKIRREWEYDAEYASADTASPAQDEQQMQGRPGRTVERIDTREIAALADGTITVHAEAEDEAGNRRERWLSYILDTKEPELS